MSRPDRSSPEALVEALALAGAEVRGRAYRCCWHDDGNASGSVFAIGDVWRFKCHGCGAAGDVWDLAAQRAGVDVATWLKQNPEDTMTTLASRSAPQANPERLRRAWPSAEAMAQTKATEAGATVETVHRYAAVPGKHPEAVVVRLRLPDGGKTYRQGHRTDLGWTDAAPPKPWAIYNRSAVLAADEIMLTEGEKCADSLMAIGITATSAMGGAGKAAHADLTPLAGRVVWLWPDLDIPGTKHMADIAARLESMPNPPRVRIIDPTRLCISMTEGDDVVEFLAAIGGDAQTKAAAVRDVMRACVPVGPSSDLTARLEAQMSGAFCAIDLPWSMTSAATSALLPGTVTILCGSPGAAKSFFLLQMMLEIHSDGVPVALMELEESATYHLQRAMAQLASNGSLTDPAWVKRNPDAVRLALAEHGDVLDAFGRCITARGNVTLGEVATWIEERARSGVRVIAVDPVSLADPGSHQTWAADRSFMARVKPIIEQAGCSLVLITHPKKTNALAKAVPPTLDDLAGGAAYPRASQTVLWLRSMKPERMRVQAMDGMQNLEVNKVLMLMKTRNAQGMGRSIGFAFSGADLRFHERGVIIDGS